MTDLFVHTKDWMKETTKNKDLDDVYKEFFKDEVVTFRVPKGDTPEWVDWVIPPKFGVEHRFPESYVSMIKNGSIWMCDKGEGMVYTMTPDQKCLQDMVFHLYHPYFERVAHKHIPVPTLYNGNLGVLSWAGHTNYWHWLHDILGRYHLLQLSGFHIDKYVLPAMTKPFQRETVRMLGIPDEMILQLKAGQHLKAESLILPSVPFNAGTCVKWTIEFLRKSFLKTPPKNELSNFERIYVSREDASWRKVANEPKLMKLLTIKGFKKIVLSSLTVQEQIDIFSSAKVIISPNGAGLANIMFCQPGTKIIQLFTSTSDEFVKIGQYLGLDYHLLKCRTANPGSKSHEVLKNLVVDVNKLRTMLNNEGIS
ncbi:glycosyltransferase family 61 protein [Oceanobacillus luteolus]|uniref:Glycosyltransferase family 61 protein n=1 Tax=Oceanobacillus luteolus TaxID=1274358 RepID=A0ABW4HW94_9BACI